MGTAWEELKVDRELERAWRDLKMDMAERLAAALDAGRLVEPIDITAPTGQTLTLTLDDAHVVVAWGGDVHCTTNVDEAAHVACDILRTRWGVVHPSFLTTPLVELPELEMPKPVAPVLAHARDAAQLQQWMEAAFQAELSVPLVVDDDGDIRWARENGPAVVVRVKNARRIEIFTVLGSEVGIGKAHRMIDRLAKDYFGLKFFLHRDRLIMSQTLIAAPFCAEQLHTALGAFMADAERLSWVAEKVLRKRVRQEREDLAALHEAQDVAQAEVERLQEEVSDLQATISAMEAGQAMMADQIERYEDLVARLKSVPQRAPIARPRRVQPAEQAAPTPDDNTRSDAA